MKYTFSQGRSFYTYLVRGEVPLYKISHLRIFGSESHTPIELYLLYLLKGKYNIRCVLIKIFFIELKKEINDSKISPHKIFI